jgi:ATP-dependent Clp protease protease subunit
MKNKDKEYSIPDMLFDEGGIVFIYGEINDDMAYAATCRLLYLEKKYPGRPIKLYINSPGGSVTAGLAIYDIINHISVDVYTICVGMAASMGAFLLSSGTKGKRFALPNAEIIIHQPMGGVQGQASDILIAAAHIKSVRARINRILALNTGKDEATVNLDTDRDYIMEAPEALSYGIIDKIVESLPKAYKIEEEHEHESN